MLCSINYRNNKDNIQLFKLNTRKYYRFDSYSILGDEKWVSKARGKPRTDSSETIFESF